MEDNIPENNPEDRPSESELLGVSSEQIKRQGEKVSQTTNPTDRYSDNSAYKTFIGTVSIVLIILGLVALGVWGWISINSNNEPVVEETVTPTRFFTTQAEREIVLDSSTDLSQRIIQVNDAFSVAPGTFLQIYFTTENDKGRELYSSHELVRRLSSESGFPTIRYISEDFMYGNYVDQSGEEAIYLVFSVNDFERAYGTMLETESQLGNAFNSLGFPQVENFTDEIIQNHDVRFGGQEERGGIFYSFPEQNYLIITTTRPALEALFEEL